MRSRFSFNALICLSVSFLCVLSFLGCLSVLSWCWCLTMQVQHLCWCLRLRLRVLALRLVCSLGGVQDSAHSATGLPLLVIGWSWGRDRSHPVQRREVLSICRRCHRGLRCVSCVLCGWFTIPQKTAMSGVGRSFRVSDLGLCGLY